MKFRKWDVISVIVLLIGVALFFAPYYTPGIIEGSDGTFHAARIYSLAVALRSGIFPAKIRPMLVHTYGYGVGFYYPDFFLYIPAVLRLIGLSTEMCFKLYAFTVFAIGEIACYFCLKYIVKSEGLALLGSVLYLTSYMMYVNQYLSGGLGTLTAYMFLPVALCGMMIALEGDKKGPTLYAIGIVGALLSHHIVFVTLMICLFLMVILNVGKIIKNPSILGRLFRNSIIGMLLTTAYWLPFFEQILHQKFSVFYGNIFSAQDMVSSYSEFVDYAGRVVYYSFVSVSVLAVILVFVNHFDFSLASYVLLGWIMAFIVFSKRLWASPFGKILANIQMTSRFVPVTTALMVILIVRVLAKLLEVAKNKNIRDFAVNTCLALVCVFIIATTFKYNIGQIVSGNMDFGEKSEVSDYVNTVVKYMCGSGQELIPVEMDAFQLNAPNTAYASDGSSADGFKQENGKWFDVWVNMDLEYYDMPYVYYYGYRAYLLDGECNVSRELETKKVYDNHGLLRVYMPTDLSGFGQVIVTYRKTLIQILSYIISTVVALSLIGVQIYNKVKKTKGI